jgi:hypothetical protein
MKRIIGWTLAGLFFGGLAAFFALGAAGGGHGTYRPAAVLFPFTMLAAGKIGVISHVLIAVALAQYPIYGLLLAVGERRRRVWAIIACVHIVFASAALFMVMGSDIFGG